MTLFLAPAGDVHWRQRLGWPHVQLVALIAVPHESLLYGGRLSASRLSKDLALFTNQVNWNRQLL